jgi:alcohol dehydrogenase class IV
MFETACKRATDVGADCVVGIGGGSVLDLAKLIAAFINSGQRVEDAFGIGLLKGRDCHLVCIPTTAGTGSEVSPNAILLDEDERLKKGVVSKFLVPDAVFIDPQLTVVLPATITAYTGLDALTHCIEAYTSKFSHPVIDVYALEGIRLCGKYLLRTIKDGADLEAREGMSMASMFGGFCLGPVNTAAVHALAYPLGGEFRIPHGLSNAILLPEVFRFNISACPERHAEVALALGAVESDDAIQTASLGADKLTVLIQNSGVLEDPAFLRLDLLAVDRMSSAAAKVTRLLKNNPRSLTLEDIVGIYMSSFQRLVMPRASKPAGVDL